MMKAAQDKKEIDADMEVEQQSAEGILSEIPVLAHHVARMVEHDQQSGDPALQIPDCQICRPLDPSLRPSAKTTIFVGIEGPFYRKKS